MKLAIIGTGRVAVDNYLPILSRREGVSLGYFNRTREKADAAAARFGGQVFSSPADLAAWKPDIAFVLTAETCREEMGREIIQLGAGRVFFEKPLVAARGQAHVSEDDFHRGKVLLDLAREKGCETAMMFNYRFFDQTLAAKRIVAERNFGELIHAVGEVHFACWSHCIDLLHHFGGDMAEITALSGTVEREGGIVARDVTAAFRMENGATGTLIGTAGMKWQHPLFELIFTFAGGRIHLRDLDGDMEVLDGARQTHERFTLVRDGSRWSHYNTSFEKALAAYLDAVATGAPPPVPGRDGLRELQTEAAMRRSIAEKRPVLVAKEFPL